MLRRRATALLVDMDGVLRRFDPRFAAAVERRYGLPAGALLDTAMGWSMLQPALVGQVSHADWLDGVARALSGPAVSHQDARAAVEEWQTDRGEIDPEVLAFVREVRAAGVRVGLATNATDRLDADLAALGVAGEVDLVLNSSVLGVHKPTKEYFRQACLALETPPDRVLFVDDSDRMVRGARVAGLSAYRWTGPADLPYLRAALGL
ncbi:HAD-IA family hydrolase [Micromonospora sp. NPDC049559]|uniref:HAD family hydrolase n=1 Tax=Micromonospora sp. NPDC049559 TaxID=3155923 RepID=UPI00341A23B2